MNYSQFLNMIPEATLMAILIIVFIADFASSRKGERKWFNPLVCLLMLVQVIVSAVPQEPTSAFGGMDNPTPLRAAEVNRILGIVDGQPEMDDNIPYEVGETVKVTEGPFSGFSGLIEEVNSEKKKLKVMVKRFGRKTPLELGFMQVEKE